MPPEFLLYMLNSSRLEMHDKRIFIELLQQLYVNHYSMQLAQSSLMPEILLWRKSDTEKGSDKLQQEERNKLFSHTMFQEAGLASREEPLILIEEEDKFERGISPKTGTEKADALSMLVAGDVPTKRRPKKKESMFDKPLRKCTVINDDQNHIMSVLENRLALHRFVIYALEHFDFHWTTSDEDLSFF